MAPSISPDRPQPSTATRRARRRRAADRNIGSPASNTAADTRARSRPASPPPRQTAPWPRRAGPPDAARRHGQFGARPAETRRHCDRRGRPKFHRRGSPRRRRPESAPARSHCWRRLRLVASSPRELCRRDPIASAPAPRQAVPMRAICRQPRSVAKPDLEARKLAIRSARALERSKQQRPSRCQKPRAFRYCKIRQSPCRAGCGRDKCRRALPAAFRRGSRARPPDRAAGDRRASARACPWSSLSDARRAAGARPSMPRGDSRANPWRNIRAAADAHRPKEARRWGRG